MKKIWVEPHPVHPVSWDGADPFQPDRTTSTQGTTCTSTSWSVGGGDIPIAYTESTQTCPITETFGPKLYSDAGHLAGIWQGTSGHCAASGIVKKTFADTTVRVAQGVTPSWYLDRYGTSTYSSSSSC